MAASTPTVSREVMAIMRRFTPLVEPISIDEAFLDVAGTEALFGDPPEVAVAIKRAIADEVRLTASVGVAATKLVAKIASELRKPDGLVVVPPGDEAAFLAPLPIWRLWGVGPQTRHALEDYGVRTIGDLASLEPALLVRRFGRHGSDLAERARGIDASPVGDGMEAKSVSHEHTFTVDTRDPEELERTLLALAEGVAGRLRAAGLKAATISVKVRDARFETVTRQRTVDEPTDLTETIWRIAVDLATPEMRGKTIRLLGVGAANFGGRQQLALFEAADARQRRAVEATDRIRQRYGPKAITRARLLDSRVAEPFERDAMTAPEARRIGRRDEPPESP